MPIPYPDADEREQRYQEIKTSYENGLMNSFQDELEGEKFIADYLYAEEKAALAKVFQALSETREKLKKAETAQRPTIWQHFYETILFQVEGYVEPAAESMAQRIYLGAI